MEKFKKFINNLEDNISVGILMVILVILTIQVVGRFVFKHSFSWSEELARYLFIWLSYLTACVAVYTNTHIKIDSLVNIWPKKIRPGIMVSGNVIFLVYCVLISYYGFQYTASLFSSGQVSLGLGMQMWIVYASIPVSHVVMALRLIQNTVKSLKKTPETIEEQGGSEE